jgi:membrane protein DedA with SNARE-associated domain
MLFTGIGIPPVPEELAILYPVGLTAEHAEVRWWLAWLLTVGGILTADIVLYEVGRLGGRRLLGYRWMQRLLPPAREQSIERSFFRHGGWIILTARLLPPLRTSVFMTAGLIKYPFSRYLLADCVCAVLVVSLVFLGWGSLWEVLRTLFQEFHRPEYWLLALLVVVVSGYLLYRYIRFVRQRTASAEIEPPKLEELMHLNSVAPPPADRPVARQSEGHREPPAS